MIASRFDSSMLTHKPPVFSFQKLVRSDNNDYECAILIKKITLT